MQTIVRIRVAKGLTASVLLFGLFGFAQGIQTSLVNLPFDGEWQAHPEWLKGIDVPEKFVFYDRVRGSVVHIRRTRLPWNANELDDVIRQFRTTESGLTKRPGFARFLALAFLPLPESYTRDMGQFFYKPGKVPQLWDIRKVEANAQNFYVSQLTPGFIVVSASSRGVALEEEYAPTKLTSNERRKINGGEALLFELETEGPAVDKVVSHFQMPLSISNQRIRYGWIMYAADGFRTGIDVLQIAFATPQNSELDCEKVLATLH
jgi:hypothetical protein